MKTDPTTSQLKEEIKRKIALASRSLLNNDIKAARDAIRWVDTATNLVQKSARKPANLTLAFTIGAASLLILALGITVRIPSTNISVDLVTKSVNCRLQKDWVLNNRFSVSEFHVTNLKKISAAGANIEVKQEQPFDVDFKGSKIVMDKIVFSKGADITMQAFEGGSRFLIKNDSVTTDIQVNKAHLNIANGLVDTAVNFEIPEIFNIQSNLSVAIPVEITMTDTSGWSIRDLWISDISFLEESTPGSGLFTSEIISGTVKILEIDKDLKLEEGDWLTLKDLVNRRIQIIKSGGYLKIHIEGEVSEISAGSELFEKKLNPTIIEYLFYAKSFAFFWSAIVFIYSLIWSARNSILAKK